MNNFNILSLFSGIIFMSYILGAIFSLIFESPFLILQKYLKDYLIGYKKERNNTYISPSNFSESIDSPL
jgi:hypothetical protein